MGAKTGGVVAFGQLNSRSDLASLTRSTTDPLSIHVFCAQEHGPTTSELPADLGRLGGADLENSILVAFAERLAHANHLRRDCVARSLLGGLVHGPSV